MGNALMNFRCFFYDNWFVITPNSIYENTIQACEGFSCFRVTVQRRLVLELLDIKEEETVFDLVVFIISVCNLPLLFIRQI